MKPVELVERAVRNSSKSRDIVLDPFGGSGTTLIACELAGRAARLLELDPKYVDVIVTRWHEFTGRAATLEGDGLSFADVKARRLAGGAPEKSWAEESPSTTPAEPLPGATQRPVGVTPELSRGSDIPGPVPRSSRRSPRG
jgi:hypothetical protein